MWSIMSLSLWTPIKEEVNDDGDGASLLRSQVYQLRFPPHGASPQPNGGESSWELSEKWTSRAFSVIISSHHKNANVSSNWIGPGRLISNECLSQTTALMFSVIAQLCSSWQPQVWYFIPSFLNKYILVSSLSSVLPAYRCGAVTVRNLSTLRPISGHHHICWLYNNPHQDWQHHQQ